MRSSSKRAFDNAGYAALVMLALAYLGHAAPASADMITSTAALGSFSVSFQALNALGVTHQENFHNNCLANPAVTNTQGAWTFALDQTGSNYVYLLSGFQTQVQLTDTQTRSLVRGCLQWYSILDFTNNSSVTRNLQVTVSWKPNLSVIGQGVSPEDVPLPFGRAITTGESGSFSDNTFRQYFDLRTALFDPAITTAGSKSVNFVIAKDGGSLSIPFTIDVFAEAGVPEPGTLALFGLGLGGLAFSLRRKRS